MVPHLTTALTGPLKTLERAILQRMPSIEHWLRTQWHEHEVPFYASVDLRNSGFKLAPVDTNLFPGGFNNLNPEFQPLCIQAAMSALQGMCPDAQNLLLIPENHTRNSFYLQNVGRLVTILRQAGLSVRIGTLSPEITSATTMELPDGSSLTYEPLQRRGQRLQLADGFSPCVILLNNDLSAGVPPILQDLEQQLLPPLHAGWATRRKSNHFAAYRDTALAFAELIDIDPWFIDPYFAATHGVDFHARAGEEAMADQASMLLNKIRHKYKEYGIEDAPFLIVKADAGTYGMGVMTIKDPSELIGLNRKQRNKMAVGKEGLSFHDVILQEGVYTFESINEAVAEPVVYMMNQFVVGGFYRVHTGRGIDENLNAPGMHFVPLAFEHPCCVPDRSALPDCAHNRFYAYGVVARLALLAAAVELQRTAPETSVPAQLEMMA